jgi:hypothetical protein
MSCVREDSNFEILYKTRHLFEWLPFNIYKTLNPAAVLSSYDSLLIVAHFTALCSCFALI